MPQSFFQQGMVEKAFGKPGLVAITVAQFVYPLAGKLQLILSNYYGLKVDNLHINHTPVFLISLPFS